MPSIRPRLTPILWTFILAAAAAAHADNLATSRPAEATTKPALVSVAPFLAEDFLSHVKYLASEELTGRLPGTPGIEKAAEYIAAQFAAAGLQPAGEDGTWFQTFEVRRGHELDPETARLTVPDATDPVLRKDWIPLPFSDPDRVAAPLAFAGFGIRAEQYDWDDFEEFEVTGKVLIVFRYEPRSADPDAAFGGQEPSRHSLFTRKARTAARLGAKGLLIVNPLRDGEEDELYPFSEWSAQRPLNLPMAQITRAYADTLLKQAGKPDLATLQEKLEKDREPQPFDLGLTIELHPGIRPKMVKTRNVLALLPGKSDDAELIVVGGHYDHLGEVPNARSGSSEPQIHFGADDNASGTAAVIELAKVLAREGGLRRGILFIAFSAEEMGLLGSRHFVDHPTVEFERIRAMINFDMVGRFAQDKLTIFGIPSAPEFGELVPRLAEPLEINFRTAQSLSGNSDHAGFYRRNVPYLFPITGLHADYHQPTDTWDKIDASGATRLLTLFHGILRELGDLENGPTFTAQDTRTRPEEDLPRPAIEEQAATNGDTPAPAETRPDAPRADPEVEMPSRPQVRLGIMPDVAGDEEPGLLVEMVTPGSAAQKGGIRDRDRILKIGTHEIKNIYGYMEALRDLRPGDKVTVVVRRDGQELTLEVQLEATPAERSRQ